MEFPIICEKENVDKLLTGFGFMGIVAPVAQ